MSTLAAAVSKDDFLGQIWSISTTLTEEAMAAALKKGKEANFDQDRGIVPLRESFINLSAARVVLEDAIEKQKLVQLPITVQKELLSNLQAISKSLQGLTEGTDEIVNLTNGIELLNTSIWKYGLHNLSDQVLGYQKKLNQIKNQEVQLSKATAELQTAQKAAEKATSAASEIEQKKTEALGALEQLKLSSAASNTLADQLKDTASKISAVYSTIQQHEKQSGELTSSIKTASNELTALDASIRKFYAEVEEYRNRINQTGEDAAALIRASEATFAFLHDLPLLFRGSIYAWFPAHVASCFGGPDST
jgi:chromosome segregation ATPase